MTLAARIAGAPISWGVCEAPEWGIELPASRVLTELAGLGLPATELGPVGYLGQNPLQVRDELDRYGLRLVGGFVPVTMHLDAAADLKQADDAMRILAEGGAELVVLAAQSADGSYDRKVDLSEQDWPRLLTNLERLRSLADDHGLTATLHPHVGTAIETRAAVLTLLERSDIPLCLDTGHLLIGGMVASELLELAAERVHHVHLKDVRAELAEAVATERMSYLAAVRAGLYTPLGAGDVDIAGIVNTLENTGYSGWYVLEQDCALAAAPPAGAGPVEDVRRSIEFLATVQR